MSIDHAKSQVNEGSGCGLLLLLLFNMLPSLGRLDGEIFRVE